MGHKAKKIILTALALAFIFGGCSKDQLLIEVYSAPKDIQKVEGMVASASNKKGEYLLIGINPEVKTTKKGESVEALKRHLVSNVQEMFTQTNFFTIHPLYDDAQVKLDMDITEFKIVENSKSVNADVSVEFIITKGSTIYHSKTYSEKMFLQSKSSRSTIKSNSAIVADMSKSLTKKFIRDISPVKTRKLVELKSLPKEISYTINYAISGNYEGAIDAMEKYNGKKDVEYYYNLAIYYEGLAAKKQSFELLSRANESYEMAMQAGGSDDEMVLKEFSKFSEFYKVFKMIEDQRKQNEQKIKSINRELGISR